MDLHPYDIERHDITRHDREPNFITHHLDFMLIFDFIQYLG
jgi:hypothetical protein